MKIALMGKSGSGKDYLASHLISHFGYRRFSFSDQLKKIANLVYPWLAIDYPPIEKEKKLNIRLETGECIDKSPREIWLHLNNLREIENQIFIRMLSQEIEERSKEKPDFKEILISDVRSDEEFEWCRNKGFTILYIDPSKPVYENYEIDKFIEINKNNADLVFENTFDGILKFDLFVKSHLL